MTAATNGAMPKSLADQWRARADELAGWAMARIVCRTDRFGAYAADGSYTGTAPLTPQVLRRHFRGEQVIGSLMIGLDNFCKSIALDIDAHGEVTDETRANNWRYAAAKFELLKSLGFSPLLTESNGAGGFHLRVLFNKTIPAKQAHAFGHWLRGEWDKFGLNNAPESFPKSDTVHTQKNCGGGWLRLPGKHHRRDFWSRVWTGSGWLEGASAIDEILRHVGDDPALIPVEASRPEQTNGHTPDNAAEIRRENLFGETPPERRQLTLAEVDDLLQRLAPSRVDNYDAWLKVGMSVHAATGGSAAGLASWDGWSRQSAKWVQGVCDEKWKTFGGGSITAGSLIFWADEDSPGNRAPAVPLVHLDEQSALQIVSQRRTPSGKTVVSVKLVSAGETRTMLEISAALSSQLAAVKMLGEFVPADHAALASVIGKIITEADERLQRAAVAPADGETIRDIVAREVPPKFAFKFRMNNNGGIWSDARGEGVSRKDFLEYTPPWLVDRCRAASDGDKPDAARVRVIQSALGVLWASLVETLPNRAADASDLEAGSAAAKRFAADVVKVWTTPGLFKNVSIAGEGDDLGPTRTSLACLVADFKRNGKALKPGKWLAIRSSIPAWLRLDMVNGREVTRLAMRFNLFDALRVPCEFATDQKAMRAFGRRCGVFLSDDDVPGRMTGGGRLAVLSQIVQAKILSQPTEDESPGDDDED